MRKPLLTAAAVVALAAGYAANGAVAGRKTTTVVRSSQNSRVQNRILVDSRGYTLYTWFHGQFHYGSAQHNKRFPPLIARGRVVAARGSGIDGLKLGTRKLSSGQLQVTYHGQPLYLYNGDHKAGQANGEMQQQTNGAWFAVRSDGHPAFATY